MPDRSRALNRPVSRPNPCHFGAFGARLDGPNAFVNGLGKNRPDICRLLRTASWCMVSCEAAGAPADLGGTIDSFWLEPHPSSETRTHSRGCHATPSGSARSLKLRDPH